MQLWAAEIATSLIPFRGRQRTWWRAAIALTLASCKSRVFSNPRARGAVGPASLSRRACATWRTRCKMSSIAAESRSLPSQCPGLQARRLRELEPPTNTPSESAQRGATRDLTAQNFREEREAREDASDPGQRLAHLRHPSSTVRPSPSPNLSSRPRPCSTPTQYKPFARVPARCHRAHSRVLR